MAILKFVSESERFELICELKREQREEKGLGNRVHRFISTLREKLREGYSIDYTYIPEKPDDIYIITIKGPLKKLVFVFGVIKMIARKQRLNFHL
jgi:hypothetical protein